MLFFTRLRVTELYSRETRRTVPQFLAWKKNAIRIMEECGIGVAWRKLFKKLKILPLTSQYLLSSLMFVVQNKNLFSMNFENHNVDTRQKNNFYLPQANLTIYIYIYIYIYLKRDLITQGKKVFNNLPIEINLLKLTGYVTHQQV